jgi:hypothetical protein
MLVCHCEFDEGEGLRLQHPSQMLQIKRLWVISGKELSRNNNKQKI